jgi:hypothetical protein
MRVVGTCPLAATRTNKSFRACAIPAAIRFPLDLHLGVLILLRAVSGCARPGRKLKSDCGAGLPTAKVAKLWQPTHEPGPGPFVRLPV